MNEDNNREVAGSKGTDTIDRTSTVTNLNGMHWSPIMPVIVISIAIALTVLISSSSVEKRADITSVYTNVISTFDEDHASAQKQLEKAVEHINGGDHNGFGLLDAQKGIFRLLGASAYRVFRIAYARDFHSGKVAHNYPYLLSNYVKFVRVVMDIYKALKVIPESGHASLDELVGHTPFIPQMHVLIGVVFAVGCIHQMPAYHRCK